MPEWREEIRRRLRTARLDGAAEAEIVEELVQHLEDRYTELRSRGESDEAARRMALEELDADQSLGELIGAARRSRPEPVALGADSGSPEQPINAQASANERRSTLGMIAAGILADVRVGVRMLRRAPGFTLVATLVIALGIGANTAVFSVVNALLLRPLPGVTAPERLAMVYTSDYSGPLHSSSSLPDIAAIRESNAFAGIAVHSLTPFSVAIGERGVQLAGEVVSADYFDVLGVRPAAGRFFLPEESGAPGSAPVIVISHDFWLNELGAAQDIVGRPLRVNGHMLTVIGVAPREFSGMMRGVRMGAWMTTASPAAVGNFDHRGHRAFMSVARLHDGTTIEATQERLHLLARELHAEYPDTWTDMRTRSRVLTVLPESAARVPQQARGSVLGMAALLMTVVGVVLLIACSNVANLLLTRASARRAEMGVRLALGATRGRIVRQLLAESVLLAVLGGIAGVLLAVWLTQSLDRLPLPAPVSLTFDVSLDARVALFAVLVTLLTGVLFGLAPALHGSRAPAPLMRDGARAGSRSRVRSALVIVQVAASVVLLVGGALFLRSLLAAQRIDIGFETGNVALIPFDLRTEGYTIERAQQFYDQLREQVAALPGVTDVSLAQRVPLGGGFARRSVRVEGYTPREGEDMEVNFNGVSNNYLDAMGIRIVRGRSFASSDRAGAPQVVVVNEAFARRFWPDGNAIGRRVGLGGPDAPMAEVVGVVPDGKYRSLTEQPLPYFYYSHEQVPSDRMMLHVHTGIDPTTVTPALREQVRALAPTMPTPEITTLRSQVGLATTPQRIAALVLSFLGALALGIAAIGLYGVVSYVVVQRTHEFGIRTALGAASGDVMKMVVVQGLRLALAGVVIGAILALALARLLGSLLLVSPADPLAIVFAAVLLVAVAALASWLPARRATRVDPLTALRS